MTKNILSYLVVGLLGMAPKAPILAQSLQLVGAVSSVSDPRGPIDAVVSGGVLYTANFGQSSVSVYDVSQPSTPRRVSTLASPGRPRQVEVSGNRLYVSCFGIGGPITGSIQAVDVSSATAPREITRITVNGPQWKIAANNSVVCAITSTALNVYNADLTQLSSIPVAGSQAICLNGEYAYVQSEIATNTHRLFTYDLHVPTAPVLVNTVVLPATSPVSGAMVRYSNALHIGYGGLIFDISNPAAPEQRAAVAFGFSRASGTAAYVGGNNAIVYDLRRPFAPSLAASVELNPGGSAVSVTGEGEYVYAVISNYDVVQAYRYTAGPLLAAQAAQAQSAGALYPNPSEGAQLVTLALPTRAVAPATANVYDSRGRLVRQQAVASGSNQVQLALPDLAPGLYIVRCGEAVQKFTRQ